MAETFGAIGKFANDMHIINSDYSISIIKAGTGVTITEFDNNTVKTFDLPKVTIETAEIKRQTSAIKYANGRTIGDVTLTAERFKNGSMLKFWQDWINAVYKKQLGAAAGQNVNAMSSYKGTIKLSEYDIKGNVVAEYTLYGVFPKEFDPGGSKDVTASDNSVMSITLSVDDWDLKINGTGLTNI